MTEKNPAIELAERRELIQNHRDSLIKGEFQEPNITKLSKDEFSKAMDSGEFTFFDDKGREKLITDFQENAIRKGADKDTIQKGQDFFNSMVRVDVEGVKLYAAKREENTEK